MINSNVLRMRLRKIFLELYSGWLGVSGASHLKHWHIQNENINLQICPVVLLQPREGTRAVLWSGVRTHLDLLSTAYPVDQT